ESLSHVRSRMKLKLNKRGTLDVPRFHSLDARDEEEMVFIIIGEIAFHLRRIHPAIGLRDIDDGNPKIRKNVSRHSRNRKRAQEYDGNHCNQNCDGSSKGKLNELHLEDVTPLLLQNRNLWGVRRLTGLSFRSSRYPRSGYSPASQTTRICGYP